jgi:hypothetical protein
MSHSRFGSPLRQYDGFVQQAASNEAEKRLLILERPRMSAITVIHPAAPGGALPTFPPKMNEKAHLTLIDAHILLVEPRWVLDVRYDNRRPSPRGRHFSLSRNGPGSNRQMIW